MIESFRDEYEFLSNFYLIPITHNGYEFPSVENAYQSSKCANPTGMLEFITISPGKAKQLGKTVVCRDDWDSIKFNIMYELCFQKFYRYPELKRLLLNTGQEGIVERNTWKDTYWGICGRVGENNLGKILMRLRIDLQYEKDLLIKEQIHEKES